MVSDFFQESAKKFHLRKTKQKPELKRYILSKRKRIEPYFEITGDRQRSKLVHDHTVYALEVRGIFFLEEQE